jgi:peptidoglycan/xylan/chitin deacetylase (PgdA/CDA1 family)
MTRLTKSLLEQGYQYFDWNVSSNDAGGARTAEQVYNNVIKGISGNRNSVVLQHDTHGFSVDAVENIIVWGLRNGYTFAPLTNDSPTCRHPVQN